ncbi:P-loop containing nucleoside triphosphate hydrolases superfamily protein [Euphorbia peplus]|nr:P-loop containing nucleoside triphosphate hydrolases superfamily protein [Euphorbia peplus]
MNLFGCFSKPKPEPEPEPEPEKPIQKGCERQLPTKLVGKQCENIWDTVVNTDTSGYISIQGRIGIGKTTILNYLNNQFLKRSYNFVVFVALSSNLWSLLEEIATQIGLLDTDPRWSQKGIDERRAAIFSILVGKRYAILIDDLPVIKDGFGDIQELGLPHPNSANQSKIIFASSEFDLNHNSSIAVHTSIIQVTPLPWEDAWSLFTHEIGGLSVHSRFSSLVVKVALLCQGLPKAIVKIGRLMQDNKTLEEWQRASLIYVLGSELENDVSCDALSRNSLFHEGVLMVQTNEPPINCYDHNQLCKIARGLGELKETLAVLNLTGTGNKSERIVDELISYICN